MAQMDTETQESRKAVIGGAVTTAEKDAVTRVKQETGRDASNLLREFTLQELIDWGRRLIAQDESHVTSTGTAA